MDPGYPLALRFAIQAHDADRDGAAYPSPSELSPYFGNAELGRKYAQLYEKNFAFPENRGQVSGLREPPRPPQLVFPKK
jgi:hypothetical protein